MSQTFSQATLDFLSAAGSADLTWMEANRKLYEEHVLGPQRALVAALAPAMRELDPRLEGVVSRIYRDMRFRRDQPPLQDNIWISFEERSTDAGARPSFYLALHPDQYSYGVGYYAASTPTMDRLRQTIDRNPDQFRRIIGTIPRELTLMGERYKRSRAGHLPEDLRNWYDRKSLWVQVQRPIDEVVLGPGLADHLEASWRGTRDFYAWLNAG